MPEEQTTPLIWLDKISFVREKQIVLQEISLQVYPGEFLGLVGPNGAGKTTLIRLMLGLLPSSSGRISVLGEKPPYLGEKRRLIGYVPQRPLIDPGFPASVFDVVRMGRTTHRGLGRRWRPEDNLATNDILERLHLKDLAKRPIGELSGGQQQLVFLGRALVNRPCLLLVDEPTASLDRDAQKMFYSLMHALQVEDNLTIVAVSHDLAGLARYTSRLAHLNRTLQEYRIRGQEDRSRLTGGEISWPLASGGPPGQGG